MVRTQIQLPAPLYREVKRIAQDQDWSVAEVMRRGAESMARAYPAEKSGAATDWSFPAPIPARLKIDDPEELKHQLRADDDPSIA